MVRHFEVVVSCHRGAQVISLCLGDTKYSFRSMFVWLVKIS